MVATYGPPRVAITMAFMPASRGCSCREHRQTEASSKSTYGVTSVVPSCEIEP